MEEGMSVYSSTCPFKSRDEHNAGDCCDSECEAYDEDRSICVFVSAADALEIMANHITDEIKKHKETP
jgi:hypothetical protein